MDDLKPLDPVALAVLADRVERMLKDNAEVKSSLQSINTSLGQVAVIQRDIVALDNKVTLAMNAIDSVQNVQNRQGQAISNHATIWKVAAAICLACLAGVGWTINRIDSAKSLADSNAQRISLVEFQLNGASPKVAERLLQDSHDSGKKK